MKQLPGIRRVKKWLFIAVLTMIVLGFSGCRTLSFYAQAIRGEYQIFSHQEPIAELVANSETPPKLREQLKLVHQLRAFAASDLKLPVNGHYRNYVDLHRPYVVWNVQAAPQFSLQPKTWWYPLVGSLEYRGYFSQRAARQYADWLARKGYDVYTDGVEAYSTLGWFKDPVLNTFVYRSEPELAEVIFHELGHQRVFARGDTDFNEAFATTVGQEGARRWLRASGHTNLLDRYATMLKRDSQFVHLILTTRSRLEKVYGDTRDEDGKIKAAKKLAAPPDKLKREKQQVFDDLRKKYDELKQEWGGYDGYDAWFAHELNNAQLNTIANYYDYLPGFEALLKMNGGDLEKFYEAADRLAKKPRDERHQWLRDLAEPPANGRAP